jgi:hypothetical protein
MDFICSLGTDFNLASAVCSAPNSFSLSALSAAVLDLAPVPCPLYIFSIKSLYSIYL